MLCASRQLVPKLLEIVRHIGPIVSVGARYSADIATTPPSAVPARPQRPLKKTPTKELKQLIQSTQAFGGEKPSVRRDIRANQKLQQGPQQWEKLECRVYEPFQAEDIAMQDIFAVIEAGHTQFKVVADDRIFVHKLDGVEVDDVIQFNKVLLVGTPNDTMVGRPHVQQVRVLGSIEEHVRDATTYIYKRRRAKGYRRFRGFRAELTAVRILGILGVEKYGITVPQWQEHVSTPLRELPTFGNQVRNRRKRLRAQQVKQERAKVEEHLDNRSTQFGVQSMALNE